MVLPDSEVTISPGRWARAAGHVLDRRNDSGDRYAGFEPGDGLHGADDGRAARHVVLHFLHAVGGLDGNAAGIEGDAFADETQMNAGEGVRGLVAHHDQRGRFGAALRDAEQRAHAELAHAVAVEYFEGEPGGLGHTAGVLAIAVGCSRLGVRRRCRG